MLIAPIISEEVEPFCMMVIGRLWKRIQHEIDNGEEYMQEYRLRTLCNSLWHAVDSLHRTISAITNNGTHGSDSSCIHASLAINNEQQAIKRLLVNINIEHMGGLMFATKELDEAVTEEYKWRELSKGKD